MEPLVNTRPRALWRASLLLAVLLFATAMSPAEEEKRASLPKCKRSWLGVPAPKLASPQDVAAHLRRRVNFRLFWHHRMITSYFSTPVKNLGVFGWTDYCTEACGEGKVLQVANSRHGFYTVDMELSEFTVRGEPTRLDGRRFVRVEIHGKAKKELLRPPLEGDAASICGKLMWDGDGFLEIHPRSATDIQPLPAGQKTDLRHAVSRADH